MNRISCPYLGLNDDPTTSLNFPSDGNFCHHANPTSPVDKNYQQQYCLSSEHTACPIFMAALPQPLPPAITGTAPRAPSHRIMTIIGIPLLIAGATALVLVWNALGNRIGGANALSIADTGSSGSWSLLASNDKVTPTVTPTQSPTNEPTKEPMAANCQILDGWVPYIVNPTDTLYRLSVIYGVSVEQLQKANCLDGKTVIFPGQVIYVPLIPTETPFPIPTPVAALPDSNSNSQPVNNSQVQPTPIPQNNNSSVQPTKKPKDNKGAPKPKKKGHGH